MSASSSVNAALAVRVTSVRGYSAYEIAVQNGYTGTEQQWLASLSGNNCTINGVSHDANYDFKVNAANLPMSSATGAAYISAKIAEIDGLITSLNSSITALNTALGLKLATANVYNALDKNESGYALDARQGLALKNLVDSCATETELNTLENLVHGKVSIQIKSITLPAASWTTAQKQAVTVEGVTTDNAVIVAGGTSTIAAYTTAGVYCYGQADSTLNFAYTTLPTVDLAVNVMILSDDEEEESST